MFIKKYKNQNPEYEMPDKGEYLSNLKKLTIFVGANNSGKSRFMRAIFQAEIDDFVFFDTHSEKLKKIYEELKVKFDDKFYMNDLKELSFSDTGNYKERYDKFYEEIEKKIKKNSIDRSFRGNGLRIADLDVAKAIKNRMQGEGLPKILAIDTDIDIHNKSVYIPMLRGLRQVENEGSNDCYKHRIIKDHELIITGDNNKDVFSGLSVYEEIKKMILGNPKHRNQIEEFQSFLAEHFFEGNFVKLTSDYGTNNLKININNNSDDRNIFEVGDGIQSIIINTFQAFKYKDENLILFIEEPELTMHPFAQRVLIDVLLRKFPKLQIFLTTHSNHFLDLTYDYPDDISIFSFEKKEDNGSEKFKIKDICSNIKILDLLGVRNSSVFLSNSVIWTEGVTDRMLLRKLFEIDDSFEFQEDYHYAFAEYGGGNLENFDFIDEENEKEEKVKVESLTKTNFLVADNDGITDPKDLKRIRLGKIKNYLGKENFSDSHVEIENLIPYKVWVKVIEKMKSDHPQKRIKFKDEYKENESAFNEDLETLKIGEILKKYLIEKIGKEKLDYFDKSENIKCLDSSKKKIMQYVIDVTKEEKLRLSDFPKMTQDLVKLLKVFIRKAN